MGLGGIGFGRLGRLLSSQGTEIQADLLSSEQEERRADKAHGHHVHEVREDSEAEGRAARHVERQERERRRGVGVGAAATRKIDNEAASRTPPVSLPGHYYPMRTGPHAHNAFLQSWYELGAIGTALFAAIGVFILALTARVTSATQPYVLATATTILVTISASFGLFETWFMGALSMCAIVACLALEYHRRAVSAR